MFQVPRFQKKPNQTKPTKLSQNFPRGEWCSLEPAEREVSSPALSTCPLLCGLKAAWFWEEEAVEEEQHVCLPAGFNLKHMYWLPFVFPAWI